MGRLTLEQVEAKSASKLQGLNPIVRDAADKLIVAAYNRGVLIRIVQGLRTSEDQAAIYAQGRTTPGKIVSNAKPGYSFHNFGLAIDYCLMSDDGRQVYWDTRRDADGDRTADWTEVAIEGKKLGFEWGGDWSGFKDYPHLEMTFGLTTSRLRAGAKAPTSISKPESKPTPVKKPTPPQGGAVVPFPGKTLKKGSEGKNVERIQRALGIQADGDFGPATQKAVRSYQSRKGLTVDGEVGPVTWNTLF
jgi:hypothetical protein